MTAATVNDSLDLGYRACLAWLFGQTRGDAPRDPARMEQLADALGLAMPRRTVHVVGTNGKGTVTTMVAASATASGLRSGAFLSPHVEDFSERISVDGEAIGREEVIDFVARVRSAKLPFAPAFFELCLAMALDHFERRGVTFAAVEAGVGARRDATAILRNVAAVAVTPIALDHLSTLGPTLEDVAGDKAAAIRPSVATASATQAAEVLAVLTEAARRQRSRLHVDDPADPLFELPAALSERADPVRRRNQRLAAATVRLLNDVSEDALAAGLSTPALPGRGERFLVDGVEVLLDGAHDPSAGAALVERAGREYTLLFGALGRKQGEATLEALERRATRVFVTSAGREPPAVSPGPTRTVIREPPSALRAALEACRAGELLVIGGSLYLAGELRPLLRDLSGRGSRVA
jgi:dihydrofolate synthase/folylpolyglutamate synthase